jgi:two-component system, sensor histidine kinase and response regulator
MAKFRERLSMIKQSEQRQYLLEQFTLGHGLDVARPFNPPKGVEVALRSEIKALQQSNEQLRQQPADLRSRNEELNAYAHTVAHALKNPLAVITVTSGAIIEIKDLTLEEQHEYLEEIKATAFEMSGTIDNLMLLSEAGLLDRAAEPLDMAGIVASVQRRLSNMTGEYHGRILSPKTWPSALGYAPWIEEVWANYISNALKYGGESPCVVLGASIQTDGMIRFWARDNGPGIPKKAQAHLFAPFTRLGQVQRPGHGLGLSIVRRIIEKSGGQAGLESEAGKGSLFFFTLPAGPDEAGVCARLFSEPFAPGRLERANAKC